MISIYIINKYREAFSATIYRPHDTCLPFRELAQNSQSDNDHISSLATELSKINASRFY